MPLIFSNLMQRHLYIKSGFKSTIILGELVQMPETNNKAHIILGITYIFLVIAQFNLYYLCSLLYHKPINTGNNI